MSCLSTEEQESFSLGVLTPLEKMVIKYHRYPTYIGEKGPLQKRKNPSLEEV